MHKTAFIGHRQVFGANVYENLLAEIENQINRGCKIFTMGTHGDFDRLALSACRSLRRQYPEIQIEVVITSPNALKCAKGCPFSDVSTVMFDIEEVHYKRRITVSNRKMINGCDTLICYVDEKTYASGAKAAMRYAMRQGLAIVNLYKEEEQPFYGMTKKEISEFLKKS